MKVASANTLPAQLAVAKDPNALKLHNGTYTVDSPDGHFTMKLSTAKEGPLQGKRILSLLVGPDNESSYIGVAFWLEDEARAAVWRKHGSGSRTRNDGWHWQPEWTKTEKKVAVLLDLALRGDRGYWEGRGYTVLLAGTCVRCNRKLTEPESIRLGIGPVCRGDA